MHAKIRRALQSVASVKLIAAYKDRRLGFANQDAVHLFIPDTHLISKAREKAFNYSTNHPELLRDLLRALNRLKIDARSEEQEVYVYHLGDLFDLWREAPAQNQIEAAATTIEGDYAGIFAALTDPRLEAQFLLGNHDFDLFRLSNYRQWERRFFLPSSEAPRGIVLHGDVFDLVEKLPDALQQLFVYYFAPQVSPGNFLIGQENARQAIARYNTSRNYTAQIRSAAPVPIGGFGKPAQRAPFNVVDAASAERESTEFFSTARQLCQRVNTEFGTRLNLTIIGHTHHPRIVVGDDEGGFFVLVDSGAWIENIRTNDDPAPIKSAQITALCANEIRIYQLQPKPQTRTV